MRSWILHLRVQAGPNKLPEDGHGPKTLKNGVRVKLIRVLNCRHIKLTLHKASKVGNHELEKSTEMGIMYALHTMQCIKI